MRLRQKTYIEHITHISIHSSQTGWDSTLAMKTRRRIYFNPLIPNGMRQSVLDAFRQFSEFQSTHPKRDETGDKKQAYVSLLISIHSSQTGWDMGSFFISSLLQISIHSSQTGWDRFPLFYFFRNVQFQSTHPKRDETRSGQLKAFLDSDFNPLIPNGMRPGEKGDPGEKGEFQSTHPKRDETVQLALQVERLFISIHSSQTGWDVHHTFSIGIIAISIHSSQTGWDWYTFIKEVKTWRFQSTHPKRDETVVVFPVFSDVFISIHSSQTGWDLKLEYK